MTITHMSTSGIRPRPRGRSARLRAAGAAAVLAAALLAGCSSENATTDCSLDECTVTFERGVDASADILGVTVELVRADEGEVTLAVADQEVTVPVEGSQQVAGLTVEAREVTGEEVVVRVTR